MFLTVLNLYRMLAYLMPCHAIHTFILLYANAFIYFFLSFFVLANTTALVLPGCRTPSDDDIYYCVCPLENDPIQFRSFFMASQSGGPASGEINLSTTRVPSLQLLIDPANMSATNSTNPTSDGGGGGLSGGAIAGIVIGVIVGVIIIAIVTFLIIRKVRDQRKNHGEYRPQLEENLHAKDLPYLPPPNIEGHLG